MKLSAFITVCKASTFISVLLSFVSLPTLLCACPPGWLAWRDSCYILLPERMNWWEASRACDRPGSSLIVPDSQDELDFVWREMKERMAKFAVTSTDELELWIGCATMKHSKRFVCSGGQVELDHTSWGRGEPSRGLGEDCVRMTEGFGGKLGDTNCHAVKFVACEIHVSPRMYCLEADAAGRLTPQCLLNHEIKNLTVTGVQGCGHACWAEPRCHSFNIWGQAAKNIICQFNNASSLEADVSDFKHLENCHFFDL